MSDTSGALIVLSGPPGAGKSTIALALARRYDRAVHLHTDDFWRCIAAGAIAPYEAAADEQNQVVMTVIAGAAYGYALGGFTTIVDGVVGPWMLDHFRDHARSHPDRPLHYVVLRPDREVTLRRAQQRQAPTALTEEGPVLGMWDQFGDLRELESHVLDTTHDDPAATVRSVAEGIESGSFILRPQRA